MNILRTAIASERSGRRLMRRGPKPVGPAAAEVEKLCGYKPKKYKDFRELLDTERPEVAIVATPDHWHPLITIDALKHGAHVYVEKPIGHTIMEGRAMVNAARKHDRVVQVGTHRRVSPQPLAHKFSRTAKPEKSAWSAPSFIMGVVRDG